MFVCSCNGLSGRDSRRSNAIMRAYYHFASFASSIAFWLAFEHFNVKTINISCCDRRIVTSAFYKYPTAGRCVCAQFEWYKVCNWRSIDVFVLFWYSLGKMEIAVAMFYGHHRWNKLICRRQIYNFHSHFYKLKMLALHHECCFHGSATVVVSQTRPCVCVPCAVCEPARQPWTCKRHMRKTSSFQWHRLDMYDAYECLCLCWPLSRVLRDWEMETEPDSN